MSINRSSDLYLCTWVRKTNSNSWRNSAMENPQSLNHDVRVTPEIQQTRR